MFNDFKFFLKTYGIIGLAIAVIIGGKLNALINSLVNDLIMPLVLQPALNAAGVSHINKLSYHGIFYGRVLSAGLEFIVVAFLIFLFAKKILKDEQLIKK